VDDLIELLTVTDRFELGYGLAVAPDFPAPHGWKARSETVTIVLPDGKRRDAKAILSVAHISIADPAVSADRRWRLVVSFPTLRKEDVPEGTKVMGSRSLVASMLPR